MTSFTSFILTGFHHDDEATGKGALQGLPVTADGGLSLLAGIVLLGIAGATLEISALALLSERILARLLAVPAPALILIGAIRLARLSPILAGSTLWDPVVLQPVEADGEGG